MRTHGIKILLADDHPLVLESVSKLLEPHFTIVDTVQNPGEIIPRALQHQPDVILLDARMPGLSGFMATAEVKKVLPRVKVILVTMLTEAIAISEAFRAGASGYVLKQAAAEELRAAIESVLDNKRFLSQKIAPEVRETLEHEWFRPEGYSSDLTDRQKEVLVLLARRDGPPEPLLNNSGSQRKRSSFIRRTLRGSSASIRCPSLSSSLYHKD